MKKFAAVFPLMLLAIFATTITRAEVRLPALISDGLVLQREAVVPIWGSASDGEKVSVTFQGHTVSTETRNGKWMVYMKSLKPGGPFPMTIAGSNKIEFKNVLVGDVWLCSGQSNMEFPLDKTTNAATDVAAASNPLLRLFTVPRREADTPVADITPNRSGAGQWHESTPETVATFTAVGYFFGRDLQKRYGIPIGLIYSSVGGTPVEAWMSEPALNSNPKFQAVYDYYRTAADRYMTAQASYEKDLAQSKADGKPAPRPPSRAWKPASLYNGMIAPLIPFALKGAIWYQGESNAARAEQYFDLFSTMIRSWRSDWNAPDLPFLFVQLPGVGRVSKGLEDDSAPRKGWPELREAQLRIWQTVPKTGMVTAIDLGEVDIHPPNKRPVGERLALFARANVYHDHVEYSGPIFRSFKINGNKIILSFDHVANGLESRGGELKGFAIAGEDKKFYLADARIEGKTVVVASPQVTRPVAVRYGWLHHPVLNLFNNLGLPASPFRTDDWEGITFIKK
jgi:sialate O-acetylesterase